MLQETDMRPLPRSEWVRQHPPGRRSPPLGVAQAHVTVAVGMWWRLEQSKLVITLVYNGGQTYSGSKGNTVEVAGFCQMADVALLDQNPA